MKFTKEQIKSFITLYQEEFGETLTEAEAEKQAFALVSLVKIIYKPMTRKEWKKYIKYLEKINDCDKM